MRDADTAPGWDDILDDDEDLIWQGHPLPGLKSPVRTVLRSLFGLPFLGAGLAVLGTGLFALLGIGEPMAALGALFAMAFSVPFIGVGLHLVFFTWYKALTAHRHEHYSLSTKRAYIASNYWKRRLDSYPIEPGTVLRLETEGRGASVWFATRLIRRTGRSAGRVNGPRTIERPIGFEHIADGARVLRLMRGIQDRQTS